MVITGFVLSAMMKYSITSADVGYRGTQLKMTLVLEGQQQVIFKPRWYNRFYFQYQLVILYAHKLEAKNRQLKQSRKCGKHRH